MEVILAAIELAFREVLKIRIAHSLLIPSRRKGQKGAVENFMRVIFLPRPTRDLHLSPSTVTSSKSTDGWEKGDHPASQPAIVLPISSAASFRGS